MKLPCDECNQPCCRLTANHGWLSLGTGCGVTHEGACQHLAEDGRCSIYETKPNNCDTFTCNTKKFRKQHPEVGALLKAKGLPDASW